MQSLVPLIQIVSAPFVKLIDVLAPVLANAAHRPSVHSDSTVASFAMSSAVITLLCILWACLQHARLSNAKRALRDEISWNAVDIGWRDALLSNGLQGIVVLKSADQEREYIGNGKLLFEMVLDSPDAPRLVRAMDNLAEDGVAFSLSVRTHDGMIMLRGQTVGPRAVLYLCEQNLPEETRRYQEILEALPLPVWARNDKMALEWANAAFLSALGLSNLQDAIIANAALDWSEQALTAAALGSQKPVEGRRMVLLHGEHRTLSLNLAPATNGRVYGFATDVTDGLETVTRMQNALDAQTDIVARLPFAIAVFDAAQVLRGFNKAYAELWGFSETWLNTHPTYSDMLDQLRDKRRIPEQRQYPEWKKMQIENLSGGETLRDVWHLPSGMSVRLAGFAHMAGGAFMLCENISEALRLESSLNLLTQVQKATLDTLDEAVAIFGTDGRLVLHNSVFTRMWKLSDAELDPQPHFAEIANLATTRIGRDGIWSIVASGINSTAPERFGEWGKARRADGRVISLSLSRLPNGATVVSFADLTDLENFTAHAAGASYSPTFTQKGDAGAVA